MGLVGVEFEFYSNLSLEKTKKELSSVLGKKIRIEEKAHSDFKPTDKEFKLEPDMSGGKGLVELVTGAINYKDARKMIIDTLSWIDKNGYTTEKSSIHLNVSFDSKKLNSPEFIQRMDPLKFILDFNEEEVYKMFPNRKNSVYAKSIKWCVPKIEASYFNGQQINPKSFDFPKEKYYGVNFEKLSLGYLEFRYIGGKDYQKKTSNVLYLLDRFLFQLWHSSKNKTFTQLNVLELKRILNKNEPYIAVLKDFKKLNKFYPEVVLTVDLKQSDKIISLYWDKIKFSVVRLISHGGIEKGRINYDSDIGRVQVKDGILKNCFDLESYDFIDCEVSGTFSFCDFFRSQIKDSELKRCNFYQNSLINSSKVESSYVSRECEATNCYVYQWDSIFKGKMIGGIFRSGKISKSAEFDNTEIINSKKIN